MNITSRCFTLVCTIIFTYKTFECIDAYFHQKPMTRSFHEKQDLNPLPSICITPSIISKKKISLHNLTLNGYQKEGKWKSNMSTFDEEKTYNAVSASFEDLVEKITIDKGINDLSDAYETNTLRNIKDGLLLERCDYYYKLKCFCINFAPNLTSHGIQHLKLYLKMDSTVSIVAPRNYFSFDRKLSTLEFAKGFSYQYVLHHSIEKVLPVQENPCSSQMDWSVDPCKLTYINNKIMNSLTCTTPWLLAFAK